MTPFFGRDSGAGAGIASEAMDQPTTKKVARGLAGEWSAAEEESRTMNGLATEPSRAEGAQPVVAAVHERAAEAALEAKPAARFLGAWTRAVEGRLDARALHGINIPRQTIPTGESDGAGICPPRSRRMV